MFFFYILLRHWSARKVRENIMLHFWGYFMFKELFPSSFELKYHVNFEYFYIAIPWFFIIFMFFCFFLAWTIKEGNRPLLYKSLMFKFMIFPSIYFQKRNIFHRCLLSTIQKFVVLRGLLYFFIIKGGTQQRNGQIILLKYVKTLTVKMHYEKWNFYKMCHRKKVC